MNPGTQPECNLILATPEHDFFLRTLYANTRQNEVPLCQWPKAHRDRFLAMQYEVQCEAYMKAYPKAAHHIMVLGQKPIGRLILNKEGRDHRVVDISIMQQYRGKGFGGSVLRQVIIEADACGASVSLHVLRGNPALHLYQKLGFKEATSDTVERLFLIREAAARA